MLRRVNPPIYFPADPNGSVVIDHYEGAYLADDDSSHASKSDIQTGADMKGEAADVSALEAGKTHDGANLRRRKAPLEPEERFLARVKHHPMFHPSRLWGYTKYILLQGMTRDCVTFGNDKVQKVHGKAIQYDNKVEHLWTYAQVSSAMIMSIAHGSNDVSNAVGPWSAAYTTYQAGAVDTSSKTAAWALAIAGLLLGTGFWFFGYHIIRSIGNRITQLSPTRGFCMELGAAMTVLLASRSGLPVSATQCLCGACVGVALMNYDLGAINWRQMAYIFTGWVLTLPVAGLISGVFMLVALNTPHF